MQTDKFETFKVLLTNAFKEIDAGKSEQSVTVVSANGYNLTVNITKQSLYPEVANNTPKKEFNKYNFLTYIPYEYSLDFTNQQLKDFYTHIKSIKNVNSIFTEEDKDALFLFTDEEIILIMREEFDNSQIN